MSSYLRAANCTMQRLVNTSFHRLGVCPAKYITVRLCSGNSGTKRVNPLGIQMLSKSIHEQIFGGITNASTYDGGKKRKVEDHLKKHELLSKGTTVQPDVNFKLPPMEGNVITGGKT